jgi:hypothetical protein
MAAVVTVNDVLNGQVGLDVECLDRVYLNGYVPNLRVAGQVVSFMTAHLGNPIPSPAIMEKIGTAFRTAVQRLAADNKIPGAGSQPYSSATLGSWPCSAPCASRSTPSSGSPTGASAPR